MTHALLAIGLLLPAVPVEALNMNFGDVSVRRLGTYGFTATNSQLSFDSGATDQLYQMFGYIGNTNGVDRVDGGAFDPVTAITQIAPDMAQSRITLDAGGAATLGLNAGDIDIVYTFTLVDDTSPADMDGFLWDISVVNNTASDLSLSFYQYLDLDISGSSGNDQADSNPWRQIASDSGNGETYVWRASNGGPADHFEVDTYQTLRQKLDNMSAAGNLSDTAAIFGPADYTGSFQYDFVVTAGATFFLGSGEVESPEPGTGILTGIGLVGLAWKRRRQRLANPARARS